MPKHKHNSKNNKKNVHLKYAEIEGGQIISEDSQSNNDANNTDHAAAKTETSHSY